MLARLTVKPVAQRGELLEVRLIIRHPMEIGTRRDVTGAVITRNVMPLLEVTFAGQQVLRADLGSGVAANPLLQFWVRAERSGMLRAEWRDEAGATGAVEAAVVVQG